MKKNISPSLIIALFFIIFGGLFGFCFWNFGKIALDFFESNNIFGSLIKFQKLVISSAGFQEIGTMVWLFIFTLITILPLSILFSLFFYFFLVYAPKKTWLIRFLEKFFLKSLNFFSHIPEIIWGLAFFSFFFVFGEVQKDSIFFIAILLFFSLFFLISKELLKIISSKHEKLMEIYEKSPNILETILFKLLPQISKELGILISKIFTLITTFGIIFLITNHVFFTKYRILKTKIPSSFSDDGETLLSGIHLLFLDFGGSGEEKQILILKQIVIFSIFLFLIKLSLFFLRKFLQKK